MPVYSVHVGFKFAGNVTLIKVSSGKSQSNLAGQNGIPGVLCITLLRRSVNI